MQLKAIINIMTYARYAEYMANKVDGISQVDNTINILSCFSGATKSELYKADIYNLAKLEEEIINYIGSLKQLDEPKGVVEIDGKEFKFDKTLRTLSVGQVIDIKSLGDDFFRRPNYVMAVLYKHPEVSRKEASELFVNDFPISEYDAVCRFFFIKYKNWNEITSSLNEIQMKLKSSQVGTTTPTRFTSWLKTLTEMWTRLQLWVMVLFFIGKNSSLKNKKRIK